MGSAFFLAILISASGANASEDRRARALEDPDAFFDGARAARGLVSAPATPFSPPSAGPGKAVPKHPLLDEETRRRLNELLNYKPPPARYVLGEELGPGMMGTLQPLYRVAEGVGDAFYDLLTGRLFYWVVPERLRGEIRGTPRNNSFAIFDAKLNEKEFRLVERMRDTFPRGAAPGADPTDDQLLQWRQWAAQEQVSVLLDAYKDTLMTRYEVERFGGSAENYARDRRNWTDPQFLAVGAVVGGTFLYLNGLHAAIPIGDLKVGVDLTSARALIAALQNQTGVGRAGAVELTYKNSPLSLSTELGINNGMLETKYYGGKLQFKY